MGHSGEDKESPASPFFGNKASRDISPYIIEDLKSVSADDTSMLQVMDKLLHWAAIIESTDDAIISKSSEGIITSWNKGAEKLYGYKAEEIVGKHISMLIPPEKEDDFPIIMSRLREGKKIDHYETKRLSKDGNIIDVSITVSPLKDAEGNIIGASKIARDVTERKEYERRRDEFVSTASHELKTPITSQKIYGELLEKVVREREDDHYLPYIKKMNDQTKKLTNLIHDLLEMTQAQSGHLELVKEGFLLDELIREIVDDLNQTTDHKIRIKENGPHKIFGDKGRIGQVLMNLLSNAIKYSSQESEISVNTTRTKNEVEICITDFGMGIPKEYHQKIFERFFRVLGTDETTYPGMGIGLSFCKEIITRHEGKIWVESEQGKGSRFYFTLPVVH